MPFPEYNRVLFKKNPLDRVMCQLKFPPILKIDTEIPVGFQEGIKDLLPNFQETSEFHVDMPASVKANVPPELMQKALQSSGYKNYKFSSEDEQWVLNLTRSFITLTAKNYIRWEEFKENLNTPLNALLEIYAPKYFTRIGLRYIDVIKRSTLGLKELGWNEILQPYIAGILASPEVSDRVENFENTYNIGLSDNESIARIATSLVQTDADNETCFMIDCDFFNAAKIEIGSTMEKLDYFNVRASRLFQWCISENTHKAMEPSDI